MFGGVVVEVGGAGLAAVKYLQGEIGRQLEMHHHFSHFCCCYLSACHRNRKRHTKS